MKDGKLRRRLGAVVVAAALTAVLVTLAFAVAGEATVRGSDVNGPRPPMIREPTNPVPDQEESHPQKLPLTPEGGGSHGYRPGAWPI